LLGCLGVLVAVAFAAGATPDRAHADVNCSDFSTQAQAQSFFLNNGGPSSDPDGLDADHDGIACESLPCPCSTGSGGGGGPGKKPGHKPKKPKKPKKKHKAIERKPRSGTRFFPSRCTDRAFQPPGIIVTCADTALRIEGITWTTWDAFTAIGNGMLTYPDCATDVAIAFCHSRGASPTTVTLFRPRYCVNVRHNYFTRLRSVAPNAVGPYAVGTALTDFTAAFEGCKLLSH
jgi:hypothetical protein